MNCFQDSIEYGVERRDDTVEMTQSMTVDSGLNFPVDMDDAVVKFSLGSSPLLVDSQQMEIEVKLQLLYADGSKLAPLDIVPVAPIAGLSSYIDSVEVWSRGILVRKYEGYNYMEYIKALCDYNEFYYKSVGSANSMWPNVGPQQESKKERPREKGRGVYLLYKYLHYLFFLNKLLLYTINSPFRRLDF